MEKKHKIGDSEESRKGLKKLTKETLPGLQVPSKRLHGAIKAQATKAQKALNTKTELSQSNTDRQYSTAKQTGKKRKLEEDKPDNSKRQK